MADRRPQEDGPPVAPHLYVDDQAVQFYKDRLERDLRRSFLRSVLVPIGSGFLVLAALLLFYWIPKQLPGIVEESEPIRRRVVETTEAYLRSPDTGQQLLRNQIEDVVRTDSKLIKHVETVTTEALQEADGGLSEELQDIARVQATEQVDEALEAFLQTQEGEALIAMRLTEAMDTYFHSAAGDQLVNEAIDAKLQGDDFHELLRQAVNLALQPGLPQQPAFLDANQEQPWRQEQRR